METSNASVELHPSNQGSCDNTTQTTELTTSNQRVEGESVNHQPEPSDDPPKDESPEDINTKDLDEALIQDITTNAVTGTKLTRELFAPQRVIFSVNNVQFCQSFITDELEVKASLTFRCPNQQRASVALRVVFPRHETTDNPKHLTQHSVWIVFPVQAIRSIQYQELPPGTILDAETHGLHSGQGFADAKGLYQLAMLDINASQALISGGHLPVLVTKQFDRVASDLLNLVRSTNILMRVIIRRSELFTTKAFRLFDQCMKNERSIDPATAWVKDSPTANALTMGNIVALEDRPSIPSQRAETCFWDKMTHLIPVIYGAVFEDEYQELLLNELIAQPFQMQIIEVPNAHNVEDDIASDTAHIKTTSRVYLAFISFFDLDIIRPTTGTRIKVHLKLADDAATVEPQTVDAAHPQDSTTADDAAHPQDSTTSDDAAHPQDSTTADGSNRPPKDNKDDDPQRELGDETMRDIFDIDADDIDTDTDIHTWSGTIIEPTDITPPGHVTIMLERRRMPNWNSPRQDRPFVPTPIDTVNYRLYQTTADLVLAITNGPRIDVTISSQHNRQGLKDMVRYSDEIWRSRSDRHRRLSQALLCHDVTSSPLLRVNVLDLKGRSRLNLHKNFNSAQLDWYESLATILEYSLLHGPYDSDKTRICVAVATEIISNPDVQHRILYAVETNQAVDEVALEFEKLFDRTKLRKKVLRLHTLPGEKSAVYPLYDSQAQPRDRYVTDTAVVLTQLSVENYINTLNNDYQALRARGDPRRVLTHLSLSHAMYQKLQAQENTNWENLHEMLTNYGRDDYNLTEADTRTTIKLGLNDLIAQTLAEQDVIVCILATAAKINLAANFKPVMTILDEAARVPEAKSLIISAMFPDALIHLSVGDHLQMGPYCMSYGREEDTVSFLNPFAPQFLLSEFERLVRNGAEHKILTLQYRCRGEISQFVSDTFYHGEVKTAPLSSQDTNQLDLIRNFVVDKLGAQTPTNRYMRFITNSYSQKEPGGTSSFNDAEAATIVQDLTQIAENPLFHGMKVGILSFYKGQLIKLRMKCAALERHSKLDMHFLTVASCQGTQFDIVLFSFVKTKGPTFINEPRALLVALSRTSKLFGMYSTEDLLADRAKPSINDMFIFKLFQDVQYRNHVIRSDGSPFIQCFKCHNFGHAAKNCTMHFQCQRYIEHGDAERSRGHRAKDCPHYGHVCERCQANNDDRRRTQPHLTRECPFYERDLAHTTCRECGTLGHKRANCPQVKCQRCLQQGHTAQTCPIPLVCTKCRMPGHSRRDCTTVISRAHINRVRPLPKHTLFEEVQHPAPTNVQHPALTDVQHPVPQSTPVTQSQQDSVTTQQGSVASAETTTPAWDNTTTDTASWNDTTKDAWDAGTQETQW